MKCLLIFLLCIASVLCGSLREEFTWTRISYTTRNGRYGGYRPHQSSYTPDIVFPGDINSRPQHMMMNNNNNNINNNSNNLQNNGQTQENYIYQNNVPMGVNRWRNKLFVTVPRRRLGVPSTLNYVWMNSTERHNVPLIPYPTWETNQLPRSTRPSGRDVNLVSIYRLAVDPCDRLWMVDTGVIELPGNATQIQPPSIVIIDLHTNNIIHKYVLKSTDLRSTSSLASIVVDVTANTCQDAFAYLPDLGGYGVIVYSLKSGKSWRVSHNYFYLEPQAGDFHIGGVDFQWNDGVFSVALSDIQPDGHRTVYFHSMAGFHMYSVSTRILKSEQLSTRSYHANDFKVEINRGPNSQTSTTDIHKNSGIMFLSLVNQNAVGCWNTHLGARLENFDVIQRDDDRMIYPCDLKIYQDDVIVLTNTMPVFLYGQLNYDRVNFRVWMANIDEAVRGTACVNNSGTRPNRRPGGGYY